MEKIWDIKLYEIKYGFKVKIEGGAFGSYKKVEGVGPTPHKAYMAAEVKLVVKPWLVSKDK